MRNSVFVQQLIAGGGDHDRIDNHWRARIGQCLRDMLNQDAAAQHAGFHNIRADIFQHAGNLAHHKGGRHPLCLVHPCVLRRERGDGGGGISALRHDGFDVGLMPAPPPCQTRQRPEPGPGRVPPTVCSLTRLPTG